MSWRTLLLTIGIAAALFLRFQPTRADVACLPADGEPIRLGLIFPPGTLLTVRGAEHYQGAVAMTTALNGCGGVAGRPVEWAYRPANSYAEAVSAAQSLIEEENVPLIVGSGGIPAVSEGVQSITEAAGVVFWEVTQALQTADSGVSSEWTFTPRPTDRQLGGAAAEFIETAVQTALGLTELRVALIYEDHERGHEVAVGVRAGLSEPPVLEYSYAYTLSNAYNLAIQIREADINVLVLSTFDRHADELWRALQEADANIAAWIHVGDEVYQQDLCRRLGDHEALIAIHSVGPVSYTYRDAAIGSELLQLYQEAYQQEFGEAPTERADLSASGVYLLLRYVLPAVTGDYTPENIRVAIRATAIADPVGLLGEGLLIDPNTGLNLYPGVVAQQYQYPAFCAVWPEVTRACVLPIQIFPTWRQRAVRAEQQSTCN